MYGSLAQAYQPGNLQFQSLGSPNSDIAKAFHGKVAAPTELPESQIVTGVAGGDEVSVDPFAKKAAQFQNIIDTLTNAKGGNAIGDALRQLSDFIGDNTSASFSGGVLSKLGGLVDSVLQNVGKDPSALNNVSFAFAADFNSASFSNDGYDLDASTFAFSFSLKTDDTIFKADLGYQEGSINSAKGGMFASQEYAHVSIVSYNANINSNPVAAAFNDIATQLLGTDPAKLLADGSGNASAYYTPETTPQASAAAQILESLQKRFESLTENSQSAKTALELLQEFLARLNENGKVGEMPDAPSLSSLNPYPNIAA